MPNYRRANVAGGAYFFTVVTENRAPILGTEAARTLLRRVTAECRRARPFEITAAVVLPDHLHMIWTLPPGDADFATRWAAIKGNFTRRYLADGGTEQAIGPSRTAREHRGVWQKRYWEHLLRDENDLHRHLDYIHYNPVKHNYASCPHAWPVSTFRRYVQNDVYPADWCCKCNRPAQPPDFSWAAKLE